MVTSRIEQLQRADTHLTRSFFWLVATGVMMAIPAVFLPRLMARSATGQTVSLAITLVRLGLYVWYAISAGTAATLVGGKRWQFLLWMIVAPFSFRLPLPLLLGGLIGLSPLSIRFLLGGQLQAAIRDDMHHMMREPALAAPDEPNPLH